jgi:hypothetical protein
MSSTFMVQIRVAMSFDHHAWASAHGLSVVAERGWGDGARGGPFLGPEPGTREVHIEVEALSEGEAEVRVRRALGTDGAILVLRRVAGT